MAMEEKGAGAMTRRGFLTALGLAGVSAAGTGLGWLRAKTANRGSWRRPDRPR